jgi:2-dehydropantoate 2-reductase
MRICVYGAGATGGNMAVRLAASGHEVSVVARGAHLEVIRQDGLTLIAGEERVTARVAASDEPATLGTQDIVIVATKATGLAGVADGIKPLIGPETFALFPQNGIPWWYPLGQRVDGLPDLPIFRLADRLLRHIAPERLLGGPIYSANSLAAPGVVQNPSFGSNRIVFAEVAAPPGPAERFRDAFRAAGFGAPDPGDPRRAVWRKLLGNMSGSALALVTGTRSDIVRDDPALSAIYARIVEEGLAIAAAHGHDLRGEVTARQLQAGLSAHKPSLLQDFEAGRPMEIGEILLAPIAFGRTAGVGTPSLDAVAAIATRLAADRGLFDRAQVPKLW